MPAVGELRQPTGTAFTIRDPLPWPDVAAIARAGEALGYAAVFLPETGGRDTLATLTGLADATSALLLGTGVIPIGSRTPKLAAMAAATVQDRSGGRHILGVGTGGSAPGALGRLETYVEEVRSLVGQSSPGAALRLPLPAPIPIWIAALGPKATRLAGAMADGVILNWCTPERVAQARDVIRASAAEAGRDPAACTISVYVRASFTDRADEALLAAAGEYMSYPSYARQFEAMGVEPTARGAVDAVCLRGDRAGARDRLEAYREAGAELPVVYPVLAPGEGPEASIAALEALSP
ncbi:MAG TPA: LLM class flavin-dependent oxidoreductase [Actinomycetota bacterium]|nr:LLM class flavin-dependent oxidoreductase [Actinomycetota bacterium]